MVFKEYFKAKERASITGVWKEVFNHFVDLRDDSYPHTDEQGQEWHTIGLNAYLFLNIVRHLFEQLNAPNSRTLVKSFYDNLSISSIKIAGLHMLTDKYRFTYAYQFENYDRTIIFGGLYYVLCCMRGELVEPDVVEKVKQFGYHRDDHFTHYFTYFEKRVHSLDNHQIQQDAQNNTESSPTAHILPFFRTNVYAASAIQKEWEKALLLKTKTGVIRYLLNRSGSSGYFNFDDLGYAQIANLLSEHQSKYSFTAKDIENVKRKNNGKITGS